MMRASATALCVLLATAATATAQVTVLSKATFESEVFGSGKNALIKFYAPWYEAFSFCVIAADVSLSRARLVTRFVRALRWTALQ